MSNKLIDLIDISKSYGMQTVLDELNLYIRENEFLTLLGPSGCGKTTTLRILGGFETPDKGRVIFDGQDITNLPPNKRQLNTVFQKYALFTHMNIAENIFIGREPLEPGRTVDKKQLLQNAVTELKKVNLNIDPSTEVSKLSCGQKQCVEIAKALSFHARVVVFDEPTASLSEKESQTLFKLIKDLKAKGVCIVYISHRMEEVFELSDRITVFRNGKYIDTVNTKDVQEKDIISMMIGHKY